MNLRVTLDDIEKHLRSLIEERIAHLPDHPSSIAMNKITHQLIHIMKNSMVNEENKTFIAPDKYVISIHPSMNDNISIDQAFLNELASILEKKGRIAGLVFKAPIKITLIENPVLELNQVDVSQT